MNWVGGIRKRLCAQTEKKQQKEFFERQKFQRRIQQTLSRPSGRQGVSQDILSLHTVVKTHRGSPAHSSERKISLVDLDKPRPINRVENVDLPNMSPIKTPSRIHLMDLSKSYKQASSSDHANENEKRPVNVDKVDVPHREQLHKVAADDFKTPVMKGFPFIQPRPKYGDTPHTLQDLPHSRGLGYLKVQRHHEVNVPLVSSRNPSVTSKVEVSDIEPETPFPSHAKPAPARGFLGNKSSHFPVPDKRPSRWQDSQTYPSPGPGREVTGTSKDRHITGGSSPSGETDVRRKRQLPASSVHENFQKTPLRKYAKVSVSKAREEASLCHDVPGLLDDTAYHCRPRATSPWRPLQSQLTQPGSGLPEYTYKEPKPAKTAPTIHLDRNSISLSNLHEDWKPQKTLSPLIKQDINTRYSEGVLDKTIITLPAKSLPCTTVRSQDQDVEGNVIKQLRTPKKRDSSNFIGSTPNQMEVLTKSPEVISVEVNRWKPAAATPSPKDPSYTSTLLQRLPLITPTGQRVAIMLPGQMGNDTPTDQVQTQPTATNNPYAQGPSQSTPSRSPTQRDPMTQVAESQKADSRDSITILHRTTDKQHIKVEHQKAVSDKSCLLFLSGKVGQSNSDISIAKLQTDKTCWRKNHNFYEGSAEDSAGIATETVSTKKNDQTAEALAELLALEEERNEEIDQLINEEESFMMSRDIGRTDKKCFCDGTTQTDHLMSVVIPSQENHPMSAVIPTQTEHPMSAVIASQENHPMSAVIPTQTDQPMSAVIPSQENHPMSAVIATQTDQPMSAVIPSQENHPMSAVIATQTDHPMSAVIATQTDHPMSAVIATQTDHPISAVIPTQTAHPMSAVIPSQENHHMSAVIATQTGHPMSVVIATQKDHPMSAFIATQTEHPLSAVIATQKDHPMFAVIATQTGHPISAVIPTQTDHPVSAVIATQKDHPVSAVIATQKDLPGYSSGSSSSPRVDSGNTIPDVSHLVRSSSPIKIPKAVDSLIQMETDSDSLRQKETTQDTRPLGVGKGDHSDPKVNSVVTPQEKRLFCENLSVHPTGPYPAVMRTVPAVNVSEESSAPDEDFLTEPLNGNVFVGSDTYSSPERIQGGCLILASDRVTETYHQQIPDTTSPDNHELHIFEDSQKCEESSPCDSPEREA